MVSVAGTGRYRLAPWPPEKKAIDIGDFILDDTAFRQATGWQPATSLESALTMTLAYYRDRLPRYL